MSGRDLRLTTAASVEAQAVRWLWPGYVPMGKVTVLAGAPLLGKSLLTVQLASRLSRGADVLLVSAEDDPADTIKPRLLAAGADCERVHFLDMREVTEHGLSVPGLVQLPDDAAKVHYAVHETGARLVVLDPVAALLSGEHSAYREQEVRAALAPLQSMAADTGCAVLAVMHLNKSGETDPLRRIGNSGGFTALARSVLVFGPDPEDPDGDRGEHRVLAVAKGNLRGPGTGSLRFRIQTRPVPVAGGTVDAPMLEALGEASYSAHDLLDGADTRGAKGEAMVFLRDELAAGAVAATVLLDRARDRGIAEKTLRRAKTALRAHAEKDGLGAWSWSLPEGDGHLPPDHVGDLGHLGHLQATNGDFPSSTFDHLLGEVGHLQPKAAKMAKVANGSRAPARARDAAEAALATGWSDDELQALIDGEAAS